MNYEVTLTEQELATVYQGLGELPLKIGLNVFVKLQNVQAEKNKAAAVVQPPELG